MKEILIHKYKGFKFYGAYAIRSDGTVVSYKRKKPTILKPFTDGKRGYLKVKLHALNGLCCDCYIHRLVAELMVDNDNPKEKTTVNHLDGDILNNNDYNLEWSTNYDNIRHSIDNKLSNHRSKCLSLDTVHNICKLLFISKKGPTEVSKTLNLSIHAVKKISQGKNYSYISNFYKCAD